MKTKPWISTSNVIIQRKDELWIMSMERFASHLRRENGCWSAEFEEMITHDSNKITVTEAVGIDAVLITREVDEIIPRPANNIIRVLSDPQQGQPPIDLLHNYSVLGITGIRRILLGQAIFGGSYLCESHPLPLSQLHHQEEPQQLDDLLIHGIGVLPSDDIGQDHNSAREMFSLDTLTFGWYFDECDALSLGIKTFKGYKRKLTPRLVLPLGRLYLARSIQLFLDRMEALGVKDIILVTIPSTREKDSYRGYNHLRELLFSSLSLDQGIWRSFISTYPGMNWPNMEELGRRFTNLVKLEDTPYLLRNGTDEVKIKRDRQARESVGRSFNIARNDITGKVFCIFDDIIASGSSIRACAEELRRGGAYQVHGLAIASITERLRQELL